MASETTSDVRAVRAPARLRLWRATRWKMLVVFVVRLSLIALLVFMLDVVLTPHGVEGELRSMATIAPRSTSFMDRAERDGRVVRRSVWTPVDGISPIVGCAVVFAEDERYFEYGSFDWTMQTALAKRLSRGDFSRGSSGISQQLVKNLFLSDVRSPRRKAKEYVLAYAAVHTLSKTRQLELYLNLVEWGDLDWGIERGSRLYFGVSPDKLTPTQAVILASVLPAPRHPNKLLLASSGAQRQARIVTKLWGARLLSDQELGATLDRLTLWRRSIAAGRSRHDAWRDVEAVMGTERVATEPLVAGARIPVAQACTSKRRGF